MSEKEIKRKRQLEDKIAYGSGIYQSEWGELIELRKKMIIRNGDNPDNYHLDSRNCVRKLNY